MKKYLLPSMSALLQIQVKWRREHEHNNVSRIHILPAAQIFINELLR